MDNLTHSLVGVLLGQTGLKRKTALATPTLIIAANLPDIDAACFFWLHGAEHLGFRRGITHGPIAMLLLPLLLWGIMLGWDRWLRRGKADRPAVHRGWLLALAYVGCLSHPALDWLNVYGIRLLEPFSSRWFYGDSIFIIDVWLWAGLIAAIIGARRRDRSGQDGGRVAWIALVAISAYIFVNGLITGRAEARTHALLAQVRGVTAEMVVASPPPLAFWRRDIFWRGTLNGVGYYGSFHNNIFDGGEPVAAGGGLSRPSGMDNPRLAAIAATNSEVRAFLLWSRMPVARFLPDGRLILSDQRFGDPRVADRFTVVAKPAR